MKNVLKSIKKFFKTRKYVIKFMKRERNIQVDRTRLGYRFNCISNEFVAKQLEELKSVFNIEIIAIELNDDDENRITIKCDKDEASSIGSYFIKLMHDEITSFNMTQL